jgi:hypothetical protein
MPHQVCSRGRKRTGYFAPVGTRYACFGTRISVDRQSKFRYSSVVRNNSVQNSGFTRAFHWCITLVVEVAASFSKYARSGQKFKITVYFGWFGVSFPKYVRSVRLVLGQNHFGPKPDRSDVLRKEKQNQPK